MSGAGIYRPRNRWVGFTVNAIEWYDIALFGALASVLVITLFPPGDHTDRLPLVFAVFATSFLARPRGAVLVGVRADQDGRRQPFVAMVIPMSMATALIGFVPTWETVGARWPTGASCGRTATTHSG